MVDDDDVVRRERAGAARRTASVERGRISSPHPVRDIYRGGARSASPAAARIAPRAAAPPARAPEVARRRGCDAAGPAVGARTPAAPLPVRRAAARCRALAALEDGVERPCTRATWRRRRARRPPAASAGPSSPRLAQLAPALVRLVLALLRGAPRCRFVPARPRRHEGAAGAAGVAGARSARLLSRCRARAVLSLSRCSARCSVRADACAWPHGSAGPRRVAADLALEHADGILFNVAQ